MKLAPDPDLSRLSASLLKARRKESREKIMFKPDDMLIPSAMQRSTRNDVFDRLDFVVGGGITL